MSSGTTRLEVRVQHLDCENEAAKIESGLRGHEGVVEVRTFPKAGKVALMFEPAKTSREALEGALTSLGFPVAREAEPGDWNLARGSLLSLREGEGYVFDESWCGIGGTSWGDASEPAPGEGEFYLAGSGAFVAGEPVCP